MSENRPDYLKTFSQVQSTDISWLWYPYIAIGKITLLLGDPEDGKSDMVLDLISRLSKGKSLPDGTAIKGPMRSMYQIPADCVSTVTEKLISFGANRSNIMFIDEHISGNLELDDPKIEEILIKAAPKFVVIDDFQRYISSGNSAHVIDRTKLYMRQLSKWATKYHCAVLIICQFTMKTGKSRAYQSISCTEAINHARSVLQVETDTNNPDLKIIKHLKNNLGLKGENLYYQFDIDEKFCWRESSSIDTAEDKHPVMNKADAAACIVYQALKKGMIPSTTITEAFHSLSVGDGTLRNVKEQLGIKAVRKDGQWYWSLPDDHQ